MHPLEVILQLQLGSDQAAVLSLPSIIPALTPAYFEASPHLQKWISRVNSLIHSKHPGARWAGLCLALQTSALNKELMTESAQNWIGITLPMLSRSEAPPTWKACIRLLEYIFISAVGMPEFQRQLATPNVPKFSTALISLAEKNDDPGIRHIAMETLTRLIPLYPTLHRTLHPSLSSLSLRLLSGSSTSPTPSGVVDDACNLHAVLHFTGGKVGAAPLWRKSLDTALANASFAFQALRTTFPPLPRSTLNVQPTLDDVPTDPVLAIPISVDRLRCFIHLINTLLSSVTLRPVTIPVGEVVKLALLLLRCAPDDGGDDYPDAMRRALEISVIPAIWQLGCALVAQLAKSVRHYLNPHLSRIISHITYQLEKTLVKSHRTPFLRVIPSLLNSTHPLHAPILPTRLVKTLLPILTLLLPSKVEVQQQLQDNATITSRKGKKRARGYEGDEVFRVGRGVLCPTPEDGETVLAALDALDPLLSNPHLEAPVRTLAARLLVAILLELPRHSPAALSSDLTLHGRVYSRVLVLCNKHVLTCAPGWINSAVGLVINAVGEAADGGETVMRAVDESQRALDVLLHPRLPPLLRAHPPLEAIALFRSERAQDDKETREALGVGAMEDVINIGENPTTIHESATSTVPLERQTWSAGPTDATSNVAPTSSVAHHELEVFPRPAVSKPSTSVAEEQATSWTPLSTSVPVQQEVAVASTPSQVLKNRTGYDSEDDDEEMPEIDMRSDSD